MDLGVGGWAPVVTGAISRDNWTELPRSVERDLGEVAIVCNIAGPAPA